MADPQNIKAVDAHQHFWRYDAAEHAWISEEMSAIRKDFLPHNLQPLLQQANVEGCIAVQADQSEKETDFLVALAREHDFIKGVVGWVDLCAGNVSEQLAHYAESRVVKGFRHILQGEDPSFMLQPAFLNGISQLNRFGFVYDVLIYPKHLDAALQLVRHFPDQPFVIDHIAKPDIKNRSIEEWAKGMRALAQQENVYCKVSGMITEADWRAWQPEDLYPYLDVVTEAFGTDRLMYGSDWPVCLVAGSYERTINAARSYYSRCSPLEQEKIFRSNAIAFYHV